MAIDAGRANKEAEALRKQCKALCQELKEALQEADVAKCRRDWAFQERDKIVAERDSIRYGAPGGGGPLAHWVSGGVGGGAQTLATGPGKVRVAGLFPSHPGRRPTRLRALACPRVSARLHFAPDPVPVH